jgi:hypothetical protein
MLLFQDGFDAYTATADLTKKWSTNTVAADITWGAAFGRFGGGGLQAVTAGLLTSQIFPNTSTSPCSSPLMAAFWFKASAKPGGNATIVEFIGSNASPAFWQLNSSGQVLLSTSLNTFTLGGQLCDTQWHWVELSLATTSVILTNYILMVSWLSVALPEI